MSTSVLFDRCGPVLPVLGNELWKVLRLVESKYQKSTQEQGIKTQWLKQRGVCFSHITRSQEVGGAGDGLAVQQYQGQHLCDSLGLSLVGTGRLVSAQPTHSPPRQEKEQGQHLPPLSLPSGKQNVYRKFLQLLLTSHKPNLSPGQFQCREARKASLGFINKVGKRNEAGKGC